MEDLLTAAMMAVMLPVLAALVFKRAAVDYNRLGRLSQRTSFLQIGLYVLHATASYSFLDSRFSVIDTANPLFGFAVVLIGGGLVMLLSTLGRFGVKRAVGQEPGTLVCAGMYKKSRNPQILSYGIAVVGYALLWPSWTGAIWVVLYVILASMMIRVEEQHLKATYGKDYVDYCARTPRFMDLPGMK